MKLFTLSGCKQLWQNWELDWAFRNSSRRISVCCRWSRCRCQTPCWRRRSSWRDPQRRRWSTWSFRSSWWFDGWSGPGCRSVNQICKVIVSVELWVSVWRKSSNGISVVAIKLIETESSIRISFERTVGVLERVRLWM